MDVTKQVDTIVNGLVKDIEARLHTKVDALVTASLQSRLDLIDFDGKLNWLASVKLDSLISGLDVDKATVQQRIDDVADQVVNDAQAETKRLAIEHIKQKIYNEVDINAVVREIVLTEISKKLATFAFPRGSIPGEAINTKTLEISGNNVKGGTIQKFNSNGIEDHSSQVQMTLLDAGVVVENKLITLALEVKGQTTIEGDLHVTGDVDPKSPFYQKILQHSVTATRDTLNAELFESYSHTLFDRIREHGIEVDKLSIGGQLLVDGNKLNYGISDTNITRLGLVRDLQTIGEALISESLYVGKNKVGINTLEPGHALSVWDQEVEIGFSKRERDVAWFGTPREQNVVLSANRKDNIVLNKDGSVSVQRLTLNNIELGFSDSTPNGASPKGTVLFNSNPTPGSPAGWISLGGGAWSRFGTLA